LIVATVVFDAVVVVVVDDDVLIVLDVVDCFDLET
jgi:hypothetical protein